jgi:hypothetical protein
LPWDGPYASGEVCELKYAFGLEGEHEIHVKAKDKWESTADSDTLHVTALDFLCGDADNNDVVNVSDIVAMIQFVFGDGGPPQPMDAGDVDCNQTVNVSDVVFLIQFVFGDGSEPCSNC